MSEQQTNGQPGSANPVADSAPASSPYRVLARKYRPTTFGELIGQEAMVRTLTNAIQSGRLAHAFILTGVRGVGKTSTARLIARALNCVGPEGDGGPTIDPCGVCEHCRAIAEDRHMDVIEMDAASRTGVDDIRELIEGVQYRPTSARTKVYIIDEVHMLSKNAFNALLKTLEEPPSHVKFVFATTEVRKVPVTVLSRCQRFDLRRVDSQVLLAHFADVAGREGATVAPPALHLIARAADGSVRDGLSLLDQAIAHCDGTVGEDAVQAMLGLADRTQIFDLLDGVMRGDPRTALTVLAEQYALGADPAVVLTDLLELVHWLTRVKVVPETADDQGVPEAERVRGREMTKGLTMAVLTRAWQMLLKGLNEVQQAPSPMRAAEMALVRLAYAAELPTPAEALQSLSGNEPTGRPDAGPSSASPPPSSRTDAAPREPASTDPGRPRAARLGAGPVAETQPASEPQSRQERPDPETFAGVVALAEQSKEMILRSHLVNDLHLVHFEPGRIEIRPCDGAPASLAQDLTRFLNAQSARRWIVTVTSKDGHPTLREQNDAEDRLRKSRAAGDPLVRAVLDAFPGAEIEAVREAATDTESSDDDAPEDPADGETD